MTIAFRPQRSSHMPTVKIHDLKNEEVGEIELAEAVFGVQLNEPLVHEAVRSFLAHGEHVIRQLTADSPAGA